MSVIDLLITVFWGYAVVMVLIFIFIIAVIRAGIQRWGVHINKEKETPILIKN
jgi:hypothetical protein